MTRAHVICGDMRGVIAGLPADAFGSVVTDPPYGLSFMAAGWDHDVPGPDHWRAALRVAKPGAALVAFGGTRTFHRLTCAIEDAGWEVRDCLMWLYGSGFPKSLDISKAIDKAAGAERVPSGTRRVAADRWTEGGRRALERGELYCDLPMSEPATDLAKRAAGWGTALKPAWEPIILARKPLAGTVAANFAAHGTGGLNIDGCRIATDEPIHAHHGTNGAAGRTMGSRAEYVPGSAGTVFNTAGRWPANVCLDEAAAAALDEQSGIWRSAPGGPAVGGRARAGVICADDAGALRGNGPRVSHPDTGGASRFFYCAKASRRERGSTNDHPTVKPLALMRWLVRLVTPPGAVVLDPFAGSGSTLIAARAEGRESLGVELDPRHVQIIHDRLAT